MNSLELLWIPALFHMEPTYSPAPNTNHSYLPTWVDNSCFLPTQLLNSSTQHRETVMVLSTESWILFSKQPSLMTIGRPCLGQR